VSERLHKLLAQHGFGSRRELEKWIAEGRVQLNGRPAEAGARYNPGDRVAIDGKDISSRLRHTAVPKVLIYHKPHDQTLDVREADAQADLRQTVFENLPALRGARWQPVNVMHAGDSGLMLLTSDGRLADALRRQLEQIPTRYTARVLMPDPSRFLELDLRSVQLDEERVEFTAVDMAGGEGSNRWFDVEWPRADRRTAVRALFESQGFKVSRVIQVRFGTIELPRDLPRGRHREIEGETARELYRLAGLPVPDHLSEAPPEPARRPKAAPRKRVHITDTRRKRR
jgi:23S rRNA pseudouridine2605 synthase